MRVRAQVAMVMNLDKFGGDSVDEIRRNYQGYLEYLKDW